MNTALCLKCGAPASVTVELTLPDGSSGTHLACQKCFDEAYASLLESRRQVEELLAAGVSRSDADKIMIARIDQEVAQ